MYTIFIKIILKIKDALEKILDILVIKENGGIHPKHRLTKYGDFFLNNINSDNEILDIGCGMGIIASKLATKARAIIAIDIDEKNLKIAKNNFSKPNIEYILGDATSFNFKRTFDAIVLSNVLEHIKNRKEFLEKIKKLSDKILIRVPMIDRDWLTLYKKELGFWHFSDLGHYTEYTIESFSDEIKSAELTIENYSVQFGEIWAIIKTTKT